MMMRKARKARGRGILTSIGNTSFKKECFLSGIAQIHKMQSHIGHIYWTFLHCAFSNVSNSAVQLRTHHWHCLFRKIHFFPWQRSPRLGKLVDARRLRLVELMAPLLHLLCLLWKSKNIIKEPGAGGGRPPRRRSGTPRHSSCLESLFTLSLYDELSAAVEGGWGSTD